MSCQIIHFFQRVQSIYDSSKGFSSTSTAQKTDWMAYNPTVDALEMVKSSKWTMSKWTPLKFQTSDFHIDFHQDTRYARICQDPYLVTKQWTSSPKAQHRWGHDVVSSTDGTWCSSRRRWAWCDHGQLRDLSGLGKINEIPTVWKVPVH